VYLARSLAASSRSVVIVDTVGTRSAGGKGLAEGTATAGGEAMMADGATTARGEVEQPGGVPRPNTFFKPLQNPFKLDPLAVCDVPWSAISMREYKIKVEASL